MVPLGFGAKVGLLDHYEMIQGPHAICVAYRKGVWKMLAKGLVDVAEELRSVVGCFSWKNPNEELQKKERFIPQIPFSREKP